MNEDMNLIKMTFESTEGEQRTEFGTCSQSFSVSVALNFLAAQFERGGWTLRRWEVLPA